MGLADTAKLVVDLSLKGNFASQIKSNQKALSGFDKSITDTQGRAYKAGQQIGTGIKRGAVIAAGAIGFLAANVLAGVKSLSELEDVVAQTNAVLASTKGASGQTAKSIRDLATEYETLNATIDDTVIQSGANLLLTFTAIRKDAFEPALKASLDLSTALHQDLQTSVLQVGKALQDPVRGITALRRAGVNFSADQIKLIKHLVDTGKAAEAQQIILAELTKEFGGSFAAAGQTATGKVAGFRDAIDDLQRLLATAMLPVIGKVADALKKFLGQESVRKGVTDLGQAIAGIFSDENLAKGADFLKGAFETAKEAAPIVAASAKATFGLVQSAVALFKSLPPEIQKLAVGAFAINKLTGGLVTNIAGGIIDVVGKAFLQRGGTPANPLFVSAVGGGLGGALPGGGGKLGSAVGIIQKVAIVGMVAEVASLISGPIQDLGMDLRKSVFGSGGDPFSDFGKAWTDWRQQADWPFGQKNAPEWAGGKGTPEKAIGVFNPNTIKDDIIAKRIEAAENRSGIVNGKQLVVLDAIHQQLKTANTALKTSTNPAQIAAAAIAAAKSISGGAGNLATTQDTLANLRKALAQTHDPKTAAILRAAIGRVQAKIPGREFAQTQIRKADALLKDGKLSKSELVKIKAIEQSLKDHGLPSAARKIAAKVEAAKKAQVAASHAAGQQAAFAIRDKDLSVTVANRITNSVSIRDVITGTASYQKYGNVSFDIKSRVS